MSLYTYRREDGTTFDYRQKFSDDPLTVDPATGQRVHRVVQAAGIVFKGSGFYVNDSKDASRKSVNNTANTSKSDDSKPSDSKPAEAAAPAPAKADVSAAAD